MLKKNAIDVYQYHLYLLIMASSSERFKVLMNYMNSSGFRLCHDEIKSSNCFPIA